MGEVVDMFGGTPRKNAKECLQGRVDEIDEDDSFTDVLCLTFGEDGMSIRTNAGGVTDCITMLEMFKRVLLDMHMYGDYYDDD